MTEMRISMEKRLTAGLPFTALRMNGLLSKGVIIAF